MAARTGIGVGMGVTVSLLGLISLTLFVLTFVFMAQKQNAERALEEKTKSIKEFVSETEQRDDNFRKIASEAGSAKKSGMAYLKDSLGEIAVKIGAKASDTPKDLLAKMDAVIGKQPSLMSALADREQKIALLEKSVEGKEADRVRALADLSNSTTVLQKQKTDFDTAVAGLLGNYDKYKGDVDAFRGDIDKFKQSVNDEISKIQRESQDKEAELNNRIAKQAEELAIARGIVAKLQGDRSSSAVKPNDEAALVDGEIVALDPVENKVIINRGRKNKVVLGLQFEVYNDASAIKPIGRNEYNPGKATIEIINIDDTTSTCRIVRNPRGNPIVKGDVIANPIYDPNKTYTFLVIGNFDTNRDGVETPEEARDIKATIAEWGGRVVDSLNGEVDFVVFGSRPVLPPAPPVTASEEVVLDFIRLNRIVQDYDKVFQQAGATSIPILNQNRLATLTGKR